ncbi:hypothetical protein L3Q82_014554, partial [Scortum barcoo]
VYGNPPVKNMMKKICILVALLLVLPPVCELYVGLRRQAFIYNSGYKNWHDAQATCRRYYTDLVTISDEVENQDFFNDRGWIGLYKDENCQWRWSRRNEIANFTSWKDGEPRSNELCAFKHDKTDKWESDSCYSGHSYMCSDESLILVKENKTWEEALNHCRSLEAEDQSLPATAYQNHRYDLVTLVTDDDYNYALKKARGATTVGVWTGLRFLADEWVWITVCLRMMKKICILVALLLVLPPVCELYVGLRRQAFIYYSGYKNWHDAQATCRRYYTDLVTISDEEENQDFFSGWGWIGLYKDENSQWRWSRRNEIANFTSWKDGEPRSNELCAFKHDKTDKWESDSCYSGHSYMCSDESLILVKENKTWEEALNHCRSLEAEDQSLPATAYQNHRYDLVTLVTDDDYNYALKKARGATAVGVWTGLRFLADEWVWITVCLRMMKKICILVALLLVLPPVCELYVGLRREAFIYYYDFKNWYDAQATCRRYYTDLVTISDEEENQDFFSGWGWIGLYKDENSQWRWSRRNEIANFTSWKDGEPQCDKRCAFKDPSTNKWESDYCGKNHYFLCSDESLVLVKENKTWEEALNHCRSLEAANQSLPATAYQNHRYDLVTLVTDDDYNYALKKARGATTVGVWTGLRFLADEWVWVGGETVQMKDLPKCPTKNCVVLNNSTNFIKEQDCHEKRNFLCYRKF